MLKGKLEAFWETGSEGVHWSLYLDGKKGYAGLHSITEGDYITIYDEDNEIIYEGDIIQDRFSNWKAYPMNPIFGQQVAGNYLVHWIQANVNPDLWEKWFVKSYRATIKKSLLTDEERNNIKNKIKEDFFKNRNFKEVLLEKSQLNISLEKPKFYDQEGEIALMEMLLSANNKYQIFNNQYFTIVNIENNSDNNLTEINTSYISKENFHEIELIENEKILKELKQCLNFQKYINENFSKHLDIMFGNVKDKEYIEEFEKHQEIFQKLKLDIGKLFLEKLKESESYKIKNNVIKLIKFSKKTTDLLRKDK